ncbi:pilus assembly protein TadG-related protein [Aurantimonas sp. 22II-16-19i]|uniref:TadE/TadG family type IV pilus assembly protein n=1 Tax=Aurantimonas sp. 22II-16-19i TaxID=1317114 RepID=UPI0009F7EB98|nr:pilus assembly protein TadG-related protein [Aurantimonas sp. 22II-16-19i]ORE90440.1 von willebrand factor type a [Aurantimonas sp. 22II-16-19i]
MGKTIGEVPPRRFTTALRRFARSSGGNFGMMVGIAAVPLIVAMGGAVDYSNALRERESVQAAADAAALAAAKYSGNDEAERTARADRFFKANLDADITVKATSLSKVDKAWVYDAEFSTPTAFLGLMHIDKLDMEVASTVRQADVPLDIVLVLDSTGSMQWSGKMDQLKAAVNLFLDNFDGASTTGKVQVAMIPFDTDVKVKDLTMSMWAAPTVQCNQMSSPDRDYCSTSAPGFMLGTSGTYYAGRSGSRYLAYIYSTFDTLAGSLRVDRTTYSCRNRDYSGCTTSTTAVYDRSYMLSQVSGNFSGCINDRQQPYDTTSDAAVASTSNSLYMRAANCSESGSLQPVVGLTEDFAALRTAVGALTPSGNTNIAVGVQWGMEALTAAYPLQGKNTDEKTKQIMIVLTDGDNTEDRWYGSSDSNKIDERTELACTNAKAMKNPDGSDLEMYTIRVIDGNESLLKSCASDDDHYYSVSSASQLTAVFQSIAERVKRIRIVS